MHSHWRDSAAWRDQNLPMSTTSDEACRMFDATLTQLASFRENSQLGGLVGTLDAMVNADADFVLGRCLRAGVELLGTNSLVASRASFDNVGAILHTARRQHTTLSVRERLHVRAIEMLQRGELSRACDYWELVLLDHPTDFMALKFAHSGYFYLGAKPQTRDSIARVLPHWSAAASAPLPLANFLHGMYAFGLTQTGLLAQAEQHALRGLELYVGDGWAAHAVGHVNEYRGEHAHGLEFLQRTEPDWTSCNFIAGHNYWHMALCHLDLGEHEQALHILDERLLKMDGTLDLVNSASLLWRLQMDMCTSGGDDVSAIGDRWQRLKCGYADRIEEHGYIYSDSHIAMCLAVCGNEDEKQRYLASFESYVNGEPLEFESQEDVDSVGQIDTLQQFAGKLKSSLNKSFLRSLNRDIADPLFQALFHFQQREFDKVVEKLYPLRYELHRMGGSLAQVDVFHQMLAFAAIMSHEPHNKRFALALINERIAMRPKSNLNERMLIKLNLDE